MPETLSGQSHEHMHRQHIRPLCAHRPHFLQHCPLWGKGQSVGRGKNTHIRNRASSSMTHMASALATWDQTMTLIRQ